MNAIKSAVHQILARYGKRLMNINSPAKTFLYGTAFLKRLGVEPAYIIDIGVAEGTPELQAAYPYGTYPYLLIEANPRVQAQLKALTQNNPSVILEQCFCGESETTTTLHVDPTGRKSSRYLQSAVMTAYTVPVKTLDSLVEKHQIKGPILLKIDVEGAEIDVLRGAIKTLPKCAVIIVETRVLATPENTHRDFATIVSFMKEHSFVVFDMFGGGNKPNGILTHIDLVFVREDSPLRTTQIL